MTFKTLVASVVFAFAPVLALAAPEGCSHGDRTEAMSCVDGFVWDAVTGTCVEEMTS